MADSIESFPFKITISDVNEHEIIIHPTLQASLGEYFFIDVTNGVVQIGVKDKAIASSNATYDATANNRCVLKNNGASFRYKANAVGAVIVVSA